MKKNMFFTVIAFLSVLIYAPEGRAQGWTNLGSGMNFYVGALAFDSSGSLCVGGEFTNAGGVVVNRIARWNGSGWANLDGAREGGNVYEMAFDSSGNLYAAGGNNIEKWNGATWTNISGGMTGSIYALACDNSGNLYAGGSFTSIRGVAARCIARWDGTTWTNLGSGVNMPDEIEYVEALALDSSGNLYAGGSFNEAGGVAANNIARWNGTSWTNLGSGIHSYDPSHDVVKALAFDSSGNLYAGGNFSTAGDVDAYAIARWNGTSWTNLGSGMNFSVKALASDGSGNLYAGGSFTTAGGVAAERIARWNGTAWTGLGSGMNNDVDALVCDVSGALYAGGYFTTAGGSVVNHIAKWIPEPVGPMIKANGSTGDIVVNSGDNLSVTVQMNPGNFERVEVDWWLVLLAGSSWFYMNNSYQWTPFDGNLSNCHPVLQTGLFNLAPTGILPFALPVGSYTFWFAVDYPMDGILDLNGPILVDALNVTVQ